MPNCLGIYINGNIIKYAKISKEREEVKVEAFGIKFYDNLNETIKQVVNETYSFKIPISINISDEKYNYSDLFRLLNKKDLEKAIKTEFEYFCNETSKNANAIEYRHILTDNLDDKDKTTCLYVYTERANVVGKIQDFDGYKVSNIVPLPIVIKNLNNFNISKNSMIVNIEDKTTLSTIVNDKILRIDTIDLGMQQILEKIMVKENSYAKAYEICKNSTIYTMAGKNLQIEDNEYMEDIMPILYEIIEKIQDTIRTNGISIDEIYLTGLATAINNIDLYFQENFPEKKCEILTPYFAEKSNIKLNIRDYIEVNSAISLGLQGVGIGSKEVNFKNNSQSEAISQLLSINVGGKTKNGNVKPNQINLKKIFSREGSTGLDKIDKWLIRSTAYLLILFVIYFSLTLFISNKIKLKQDEFTEVINDTQTKISEISNNGTKINARATEYENLVVKIDEANNQVTESYSSKNAIPNFLTQLMFNMPKKAQIISIKNTTDKTIEIQAQAEEYDQLGYLKSALQVNGILTGITSTSGTKQGNVVQVTITGSLPY